MSITRPRIFSRWNDIINADGWVKNTFIEKEEAKRKLSPYIELLSDTNKEILLKYIDISHLLMKYPETDNNESNDVTISEVHDFLMNLEEFINKSEKYLTFPASKKGWETAVLESFKRADYSKNLYCGTLWKQISAVGACSPETLEKIVKEHLNIKDDHIIDKIDSPKIIDDKIEKNNSKSTEKTKTQKKAKEFIYRILNDINDYSTMDLGRRLDLGFQTIKNELSKDNKYRFWWTECFIPELSKLSIENINAIVSNWPQQHKIIIEDPEKWVSHPSFWRTLKTCKPEVNDLLHQHVLSDIINSEFWNESQFVEILDVITLYTDKDADLFNNRMKLWMSMGGHLDIPIPSKNNDEFVQSKTVYEYLIEKNHSVWTSVLEKIRSPVTPKRGMNA